MFKKADKSILMDGEEKEKFDSFDDTITIYRGVTSYNAKNIKDLVVINKQAHANEGDIVVALIDNESTLKRFYKDDENKRVILRAENKKYKDIIRPSCTIQGVAQHVIKRV